MLTSLITSLYWLLLSKENVALTLCHFYFLVTEHFVVFAMCMYNGVYYYMQYGPPERRASLYLGPSE